jgi:hypothetical protein
MSTNNPTPASTERGWALLYACMICFAPSRDLAKYLYQQSRPIRTSRHAIGGLAICINHLVLLQLQSSTLLPHKIHPSMLEMNIHIEPVMRYHIPEQVGVCSGRYMCMMYVCMYVCMCVCMYVWMDVCMYVCMDGWMDGWMDGCV